MTRLHKKISNYVKNVSHKLFWIIVVWCALGVGGVFGAWGLWSLVGLTDSAPHATASLAVVGGVGGVVALVIAFRKQSAAERGEGQDRLGDAVRLLGDSQPSTRIAGVYAIIATGKRHPDLREQAADILCGYLRTARPADDAPVESTIIHRLQDVLRKDNPDRWQHIDIDVHGTTINATVELDNSVMATVDFSHTTFYGPVTLDDAEFENFALFQNTIFKESVAMRHAKFKDGADFTQSEFHKAIDFLDAEFTSPHTEPVMKDGIQQQVAFQNAVYFNAAHFHEVASFGDTRFITDCVFSELKRRQSTGKYESLPTTFELAHFSGTKFLSFGRFDGVEFAKAPLVNGVEFHNAEDEAQFNQVVAAARQ